MTALRIGSPCEFKAAPGLGGWRPGTVTGFVGKLIEVEAGGALYLVPSSRVRPAKEETRPDRGAQQAKVRAETRAMMEAEHRRQAEAEGYQFSEPALVIAPDVEPSMLGIRARGPLDALTKKYGEGGPWKGSPQPKAPKPTRSEAYKKWVRLQPCALTGEMAEDAHHYENGGMGRKCSDYMTVPLTHEVHMAHHAGRPSQEARMAALAAGETYDTLAAKLAMAEAGWRALVAFIERKEGGEDE